MTLLASGDCSSIGFLITLPFITGITPFYQVKTVCYA